MKHIRWFDCALPLFLVAATAASADAGFRRRAAARCAPPACGASAQVASCNTVCGHYEDVVVDRVVYVRETTHEVRNITVTECRPEMRQRSFPVSRRVPYTETVTQEYTVMVQQTQMRQVTQMVYKPVTREVQQTYTVLVPQVERKQGVRQVVNYVCEPQTINVCVDRGHWETRTIEVPCATYGYGYYGSGYAGYGRTPCGGCGGRGTYAAAPCGSCGGAGCYAPATVTRCVRVWVPNVVQEQVTRNVMKPVVTQVPYEYCVTVCRPEQRTRTVTVCDRVAEPVTREVAVTVCVPERKTRTCEVTKYRTETETRVENYAVMVPHQVEKQITVPVCRVVPKTVQCVVRQWVPNAPADAGVGPNQPEMAPGNQPLNGPGPGPTTAPPNNRPAPPNDAAVN